MSLLTIDDVDLAQLTEMLRRQLGDRLEANYLRGRTVLRDAVTHALGCSMVQAEQLVETLELQRFVRFPQFADDTHPAGRRSWEIGR